MIVELNSRRPAVLSLELLFVLPLLFVLLLGMIEFSTLLSVRQQLVAASREGARVAAMGGDGSDVDLAVRRFLGEGVLQCARIEARLNDESGNPVASGEPVVVRVQITASKAVPDLLRWIGVDLRDKELCAVTVMRKE